MPFKTLGEPAVYTCDRCQRTREFEGSAEYPMHRASDAVTLCWHCAEALAWEAYDAEREETSR